MKSLHIKILISCLLINNYSIAQSLKNKLESFTDSLYKEKVLYGNVVVKDKGEIILQKSYGYADIDNKKTHSAASLFDIGSIGKLFTSTAILQLKEKGKLSINDLVQKHLPSFPYNNVTIKHLLTHTAGLPYAFDELYWHETVIPNLNTDTILDHLKGKQQMWDPGTKWEYSNTAYCMLALIVEKLSGKEFPDYIVEHIFKPAGMKDSYFYVHDYSKIRSYREDNLIKGREIREDTSMVSKVTENVFGTGDILSTALDLINFEEAFFKGKLISEKTITEALSPQRFNNDSIINVGDVKDNVSIGLGWFIMTDNTYGKIYGHTGGVPGTKSYFFCSPNKKQACILLDNYHSLRVNKTGENIYEILNNRPPSIFKSSRAQSLHYLRTLVNDGPDAAFIYVQKCLSDTVNHTSFNEHLINNIAIEEIFESKTIKNNANLALEALKMNIILFPKLSRTYNSYAWILSKIGKKEEAIWLYQKSLTINPDDEEVKNELKNLLK